MGTTSDHSGRSAYRICPVVSSGIGADMVVEFKSCETWDNSETIGKITHPTQNKNVVQHSVILDRQ